MDFLGSTNKAYTWYMTMNPTHLLVMGNADCTLKTYIHRMVVMLNVKVMIELKKHLEENGHI